MLKNNSRLIKRDFLKQRILTIVHSVRNYVIPLVPLLDGKSGHVAPVRRKQVHFEINFKLVTSIDLNISLKQIKLPISLYTCVHISELPSNISTMGGM